MGGESFSGGGGGGVPALEKSLGSGDCFDAHQHIPYIFLVGVEDKIHIVDYD